MTGVSVDYPMVNTAPNVRDLAVPRGAPGACHEFRCQVSITTKNALSFLSRVYHFEISARDLTGLTCASHMKEHKEFLSSFLVLCLSGTNPFPRLSFEDSLSLSASINSITKAFPDSCPCMEKELFEDVKRRLTAEKRTLPNGYISHVRRIVSELFPKGVGESSIKKRAEMVVPPLTSTTIHGRKDGGSYAYWEGRRDDYLNAIGSDVIHEPIFMVAKDAGKPRPLFKNDPSYLTLKPLHSFLYDTLSSHRWLLRGPPSRGRLRRSGFTETGSMLSADFSSATDNLPIEVSEAIIDELSFLSCNAIQPYLAEARKSLRPDPGFEVTTGQFMGNLLSFPLLCLQNYIATRWVDDRVGTSPPRLINGDDLLVQCDEIWCEEYRKCAPLLGFTLNEKKTSYASFATINSCYYSRTLREIPFARLGALKCEDFRDLGEAYDSVLRSYPKRHSRLSVLTRELLAWFEPLIRASRHTLFGLGIRVTGNRCPRALWRREKRRTDDSRQVKKPQGLFHARMVRVEDPLVDGLVENVEIAGIIVRETWKLGKFERGEEQNMGAVWKEVKRRPNYRGRERAAFARSRLAMRKEKKHGVVIPDSLVDCLTDCHWRSRLDDGFVIVDPCEMCDKIQERRMRARKYESLIQGIRDAHFLKSVIPDISCP
nr:MAG: RNA-dependent RNA polymerase [Botourmiaviridae sp.]